MAINQRFLIVKDKDTKEIRYFDYDKIDGYDLKAKKDVRFEDAINISRIIIINPSFSEKIATKKMNSKFNDILGLLNYVVTTETPDDDGSNLDIVLDRVSKFKRELINKYHKYVEEEKLDLMLKKVEIVEREVRLRKEAVMLKREQKLAMDMQEEKIGKSR